MYQSRIRFKTKIEGLPKLPKSGHAQGIRSRCWLWGENCGVYVCRQHKDESLGKELLVQPKGRLGAAHKIYIYIYKERKGERDPEYNFAKMSVICVYRRLGDGDSHGGRLKLM